MANAPTTPGSDPRGPRSRKPRLRTNVVIGEDAAGEHHCVYVGPSADEALAAYARLRENGGLWDCRHVSNQGPLGIQFIRAVLSIDPSTSKHCSFAA